jgi:glucose-6-phosphate 1-dehydrogenase
VLDEEQVYRIDHFLGKEATQDLHVLRFANGLFAGMWDRQHVESVQIDVPERLGVTDRSVFYDATGAVLDMLVTHLFQVAAEVAMEPPASLDAADLQTARERVIRTFRPLDPAEVVLGQFSGYKDVPGVAARSKQNTYVAARLWVDNPRWTGVPFLLRTGKCMADGHQRVSVLFKDPVEGLPGQPLGASILGFELSGNGDIELSLVVKEPGPTMGLTTSTVTIPLGTGFHTPALPAYSRLLHDVLMGDRSLFTRPDGLAHVWTVAAGILGDKPEPAPYAKGSWGPAAAAELAKPGTWHLGQ